MGEIINFSPKKLVLARGLPGSGVTTLATRIAGDRGTLIACKPGCEESYFSAFRQASCLIDAISRVEAAMARSEPLIVVDRHHKLLWEMRRLAELAIDNHYEIEFAVTNPPWNADNVECARRSSFQLDQWDIEAIRSTWENGSIDDILVAEDVLDEFEALLNGRRKEPSVKLQACLVKEGYLPCATLNARRKIGR